MLRQAAGFDPLFLRDFFPVVKCSVTRLHNSEVKHGRAAMLAMLVIGVQEFIAKSVVMEEDSRLFAALCYRSS